MCFYINQKFNEPIISEYDILVFKKGEIVNNRFQPFSQSNFEYKIDKITKTVKIKKQRELSHLVIHEGYHAFTSLYSAKKDSFYWYNHGLFVIPKGTKFYYDPINCETVSENLIYVGKVTEKLISTFRTNEHKLLSELKLKPNANKDNSQK